MTHDELIAKLIELEFKSGWGVRDGKIVVWENKKSIPDELIQYVELDETATA